MTSQIYGLIEEKCGEWLSAKLKRRTGGRTQTFVIALTHKLL
jgi:hypothetical protein